MKNNSKLYIIAAGLASRMGGYPKHLCTIDNKGTTNIENTLSLASMHYDEIVVVLNKMLASEYAVKTIAIAEKYNAEGKFTGFSWRCGDSVIIELCTRGEV